MVSHTDECLLLVSSDAIVSSHVLFYHKPRSQQLILLSLSPAMDAGSLNLQQGALKVTANTLELPDSNHRSRSPKHEASWQPFSYLRC